MKSNFNFIHKLNKSIFKKQFRLYDSDFNALIVIVTPNKCSLSPLLPRKKKIDFSRQTLTKQTDK